MATKSNSQISTLEDDVTEGAAVAPVEMSAGGPETSGAKESITIHSSPEDGGNDAVFVSHNGYAYQIPRDKPFVVPTEVAQILRDAVVTSYKPGSGGVVTEQKRQRFAFSSTAA